MKLALAFLVLSVAPAFAEAAAGRPAWAQCEASRQKQADLKKEADVWWARHLKECTLCADGSACREGFEHRDGGKRQFEAWRSGHGLLCAACGATGCALADAAWTQSLSDAKARHREKCRKCEFDPLKCEAWKPALDEAKLRHDAWKREHPATCDRCSPPCDEWRRRAAESVKRHDETLQRHKDRCTECRAAKGGCDRPAAIRQDWTKERLALWKAHETCPCQARTRTPVR